MTNPAAGVEAEPTPGERLLVLSEDLWHTRSAIAAAEEAMRLDSPIDVLRDFVEIHDLTDERLTRGIADQDCIDIGDNAVRAFLKYTSAEELRDRGTAEAERLETELLEHASSLVSAAMRVAMLPGADGTISWKYQTLTGGDRTKQLAEGKGAIAQSDPRFILEHRLELLPHGGLWTGMVGGTYHVPLLDETGQRQVSLDVEQG